MQMNSRVARGGEGHLDGFKFRPWLCVTKFPAGISIVPISCPLRDHSSALWLIRTRRLTGLVAGEARRRVQLGSRSRGTSRAAHTEASGRLGRGGRRRLLKPSASRRSHRSAAAPARYTDPPRSSAAVLAPRNDCHLGAAGRLVAPAGRGTRCDSQTLQAVV
jgi:hypothetical protein